MSLRKNTKSKNNAEALIRASHKNAADDDCIFDDDGDELPTKKRAPAYEVVHASKLEDGEVPLNRVIGHANQKEELLSVIDWFKRSKELKEKGVSIPRGAILFGDPGNGKSLLIREIIRCCDCPAFVFQGEQTNVAEGIIDAFRKAREAGHAIIVFDELDLLINRENRVSRVLQENLDGVESDDDILVLAATNCIHEIPEALLRHGRLEKLIEVPYPTGEEALELFKANYKAFGLKFPEDFDDEEVALSLNGLSCAGVKAAVNDLVLRNGFAGLTSDMIEDSIFNVVDRVIDTAEDDNLEVAIHEAGHAVVTKAFPQFFRISRLNISGASGSFHAKEVEKEYWPYDKVIADIKIAMAGVLAQKIICGRGSRGCASDLQQARNQAYNAFTSCGYSSCWETLPMVRQYVRLESPVKLRKLERKIERLLRKCERETARYIKAHKSQILALGQLLYKKKRLMSNEILSCIG